jgi:heterokaryon incompatibility protein (HET)
MAIYVAKAWWCLGLSYNFFVFTKHQIVTMEHQSLFSEATEDWEPSEIQPVFNPLVQAALGLGATGLSFCCGKFAPRWFARLHPTAPSVFAIVGIIMSQVVCSYVLFPRAVVIGDPIVRPLLDIIRRRGITQRLKSASNYLDLEESLPSYSYTALPGSRHIRLLMIDATNGRKSKVFCDIVTVPVDHAPRFDAVSYCWGSDLQRHSIDIGSPPRARLQITQSVYNALTHLTPLSGRHYLWIDYISINQGDPEEKAHQIPLMRDVYTKATRVVGVLEGDGGDAALANRALQKISSIVPYGGIMSFYSLEQFYDLTPSTWHAISDLAFNPYFRRRWIIQECILAKDLCLIYGGIPVSWTLMGAFGRFPSAWMNNLQDRKLLPRSYDAIRNTADMIYIRQGYKHGDTLGLSVLAVVFSSSLTTIPHDTVYSLLGLCSPSESTIIEVDYQKPLISLFMEVVKVGLQAGSFRTFSVSGIPISDGIVFNHRERQRMNITQDLPSWVPDLENCPPIIWTSGKYHHGHYSAGKRLHPEYYIVPNLRQLSLKGVFLDTIEFCGSAEFERSPWLYKYFLDTWAKDTHFHGKEFTVLFGQKVSDATMLLWRHFTHTYRTGEPTYEAFLRTLIENIDNIGRYPADINYVWSAGKFFDWLRDSWWAQGNEVDPYRDGTPMRVPDGAWEHMRGINFTGTRNFAITKDRYMALVPHGTMEGDVVAIMLGAPAPFILRPTGYDDGSYFFRGEAYVHGIMDGEAMMELEKRWFILR